MIARAAIALIATVSAAAAAPTAPPADERQALRRYCSNDYSTFCSEYDIGSPKVRACFRKNRAKLSEACRGAISSYLKGGRRKR